MPERLVDRSPQLDAAELAAHFVPPPRFERVRFDTFEPNPDHPSQAAARHDLEQLAAELSAARGGGGRGLFRRRSPAPSGAVKGRYLDGGFGVGKTHLLASTWHAAPAPKSILSFEELTAFIGFVGMDAARRTFSGHRLLCIDEFELDDVANTRMMVTFLRAVVDGGTTVVTTSNAVPDRLGEGRFNAEEFSREIADIAAHFDVVRIDGPDFRAGGAGASGELLDAGEVESVAARHRRVTVDRFDDLLAHLRRVHPVHYRALVDDLEAVAISGVHPVENQGDALLFVQLVDEIYDAGITLAAAGCPVGEIFPESYRRGGYRKKYGRCESRLAALVAESRRRAGEGGPRT